VAVIAEGGDGATAVLDVEGTRDLRKKARAELIAQ
jgi:hypothetical protein